MGSHWQETHWIVFTSSSKQRATRMSLKCWFFNFFSPPPLFLRRLGVKTKKKIDAVKTFWMLWHLYFDISNLTLTLQIFWYDITYKPVYDSEAGPISESRHLISSIMSRTLQTFTIDSQAPISERPFVFRLILDIFHKRLKEEWQWGRAALKALSPSPMTGLWWQRQALQACVIVSV